MIPWNQAVRHALAQGEWPLWNPLILWGDVLAATTLALVLGAGVAAVRRRRATGR